jgi:hypothetical protein
MYRRTLLLASISFILLVPAVWAAQHEYSTGKILNVQRKTRQKVDMYLVNTPVGSEVPYFEITVRAGQIEYTAEYTPRHENDELPTEWVADSDVPVRLEKHSLFLKRSDGTELRWIVTKHKTIKDK